MAQEQQQHILSILLWILTIIATSGVRKSESGGVDRLVTVMNSCEEAVWPAVISRSLDDKQPTSGDNFELKPGESSSFKVSNLWSGEIWGRTGCDPGNTKMASSNGIGKCQTGGNCDGFLAPCYSSQPPVTLAEFVFQSSSDVYKVKLVNGFNLPLVVIPVNDKCGTAGCSSDLRLNCSSDLALVSAEGKVIGCQSACQVFKTDQYCCTGDYATSDTCKPTLYSKLFKEACPTAYSYSFDDLTSTFTCLPGSEFLINFCPTSISDQSYRKMPDACETCVSSGGRCQSRQTTTMCIPGGRCQSRQTTTMCIHATSSGVTSSTTWIVGGVTSSNKTMNVGGVTSSNKTVNGVIPLRNETTTGIPCEACVSSGGCGAYNQTFPEFVGGGTSSNGTVIGGGPSSNKTVIGGVPLSNRTMIGGIPLRNKTIDIELLPLGSKIMIGVFVGVGVVGGLILLFLLFIYLKNQRKRKERIMTGNPNVEQFLETYGCLSLQRYKYKDIKKMTNSFKDKLGHGGYGSVFKGKLVDGRLVAVKKLINDPKKCNGEEFLNEVTTIGRTNHINVVSLLGFCISGSRRALVYEFMANGSLEKFIYPKLEKSTTDTITSATTTVTVIQQLGWEKLYQIALGIARGLEYLHRDCNTGRILHFDIKPHNILLDEKFCPKISDFGLAKLCSTTESIVSMHGRGRGTVGYIAPEVYCRNFGRVSYKSDVYSYGMMVLEMVGGRKNIDPFVVNRSEIYFPHWIYDHLEDQDDKIANLLRFEGEFEEEMARKMILVGLWCIQTNPSNRPSMSRVSEMLEGRLEDLEMPPKPVESLSPRASPAS